MIVEMLTIAGAVLGSGVTVGVATGIARRRFQDLAEKEDIRRITSATPQAFPMPHRDIPNSSVMDRVNRLSICGHIGIHGNVGGCGRYSRDYQQKLAWLVENMEKDDGKRVNLKGDDHQQICPHCKKSAMLRDALNTYEWLKVHPDCPMIDEWQYADIKQTERHLKDTIKEMQEIQAFLEYNKLVESQTQTEVVVKGMPTETEELAEFLQTLFSKFGVDLESLENYTTPKEIVNVKSEPDTWERLDEWDKQLLAKIMEDGRHEENQIR